MNGRTNRRRVLQVSGAALWGLSGCLRLASQSGPQASTETNEESTAESDRTETTTETVTPTAVSVTDDWPQFQYDDAKSGHHPETTGPTDEVERAWTFQRRGRVPDTRRNERETTHFNPVVAGGSVFVSSQNDDVYSVDAATGEEQWRFTRDAFSEDKSRKSTPTVVDGTVYAEGSGGYLYALDAETGEEKWTIKTTFTISATLPVVHSGTIYVTGNGNVLALDAGDGSIEWRRTEESNFEMLAVSGDAVYAMGTHPKDRLYALDSTTGETRWTVDGLNTAPSVVDGTVYATQESTSPKLFAVDAGEGTVRWKRDLPASVHGMHSPAVAYETLFLGTKGGAMYAFDVNDGSKRWEYETTGDAIPAPATVVDGHVYFGGSTGKVFCVSAEDGTRKWTVPVGDVAFTPAVVDDTVFVSTASGRVHAITART